MTQHAVIDRRQAAHPSLKGQRSLAVAQLAGTAERVLTVVAADAGSDIRVDSSRCIAIPSGLGSEQALQLPALAWSLWAWDQLDLELGEFAIYCPGSPFDHLVGAAALLYGALPVIQIGTADFEPAAGVQVISSSDTGVLIGEVRERTKSSVGVAAIDLSGQGGNDRRIVRNAAALRPAHAGRVPGCAASTSISTTTCIARVSICCAMPCAIRWRCSMRRRSVRR